MNYPMFSNNNPMYMQNLQSLQDMSDRIDNQIKSYQQTQMQQPIQQPQIPQVNQTFQLAPNSMNNELESKYVNNVDEVRNTFVMKTGIFINKDFSTLWVKDVTGNIRTFRTEEVIEMDEKDKEIYMLKRQLEEMKGMMSNANESVNANVNEQITKSKPPRVQNDKRSNAK